MAELDLHAIVHENGPFVWRVLRHLGVAENQLPDLSQEVFMVLMERPNAFQARASLRTFLYGVCRNLARSARRTRREMLPEALPEQAAPADQERSLAVKESYAQLTRVLQELSEEQRMIFVLHEIEEVSMEEIAQAMRTPLRTCYSRLEAAQSLVRARFRRELLVRGAAPRGVAK